MSSSIAQIKQCDSIKVYNSDFDIFFQREYKSITSDSILAIRHCYTTNGCSTSWGILCWKSKGAYNYKMFKRTRYKIKSYSKLNKNLSNHLIDFYTKKIYELEDHLPEGQSYKGIDDGPYTILLLKTFKNCWRYEHNFGNPKDDRAIWTQEHIHLLEN